MMMMMNLNCAMHAFCLIHGLRLEVHVNFRKPGNINTTLMMLIRWMYE